MRQRKVDMQRLRALFPRTNLDLEPSICAFTVFRRDSDIAPGASLIQSHAGSRSRRENAPLPAIDRNIELLLENHAPLRLHDQRPFALPHEGPVHLRSDHRVVSSWRRRRWPWRHLSRAGNRARQKQYCRCRSLESYEHLLSSRGRRYRRQIADKTPCMRLSPAPPRQHLILICLLIVGSFCRKLPETRCSLDDLKARKVE